MNDLDGRIPDGQNPDGQSPSGPITPVALAAPAAVAGRGHPSGCRKWFFRLAAMTVVPVLLLVLLEFGLRVFGYGYSADFFLPQEVNEEKVFLENKNFGRRFFPAGLKRTPRPVILSTPKQAGTYRIFILGESAAQGFPDSSVSFARILEAMLEKAYPDTRFEVLNTAMTAINSHVILPIASDCARHEPDLFVVYMGNNEVVGPFGPSGVLGPHATSLGLVRASVWVKATRTGQLLGNVLQSVGPAGASPRTWGGPSMFIGSEVRADDPRMETVYAHFERNLQDICNVARTCGAKVVLCTVASNLKDSPPFSSSHAPNLGARQAGEWERKYQEGIVFEWVGDAAEALKCYDLSAAIDDQHAEMHFRMARCLATLDRGAEARLHYIRARDQDTLRLRADTRINKAIRALAAERAAEGVSLADAEACLESASPLQVPGDNFFHEYVHLSFEGNYQLARVIFEQLAQILPESIRAGRAANAAPPSEEACRARLAFGKWSHLKALGMIASGFEKPPFSTQLDAEERIRRLRGRIAELQKQVQTGIGEEIAVCRRALEMAKTDWMLHEKLAEMLMASGQMQEAANHLQIVRRRLPHRSEAGLRLALLWADLGKFEKATALIDEALHLTPDEPEVHTAAGFVQMKRGDFAKAIAAFTEAVKGNPNHFQSRIGLGHALVANEQFEQAVTELSAVTREWPDNADAHFNLGNVLNAAKKPLDAITAYTEALRLNPAHAHAQNNLGKTLSALGRHNEAIQHFEEALRLLPGWPEVIQAIAQARAKKDGGRR